MAEMKYKTYPATRIATVDICNIGRQKNHVTAMIEVDVTEARQKIRHYRREKGKISFSAWLIKTISSAVSDNEAVAAYRKGKRRIAIFEDINVTFIVEKTIQGDRVPIPMVIEKADKRSTESITGQIEDAKGEQLSGNEVVLQRSPGAMERLYYHLPGFIRRFAWRRMLSNPRFIYGKMGNVSVTSLGMVGAINGWFIPISVHPLCFGIGSVIKKPHVHNNAVEIREILNLTILMDHDVIDGAPMARFIKQLTDNIETGIGL